MNVINTIRYLKNPGLLNENSIPELETLINEFPAFDLGWALYLKNLKNIGSENYNSLLPVVSARISDRKWLKRFLEMPAGIQDSEKALYLSIDDYSLENSDNTLPDYEDSRAGKMSLIENFLAAGGKIEWNSGELAETLNKDLSEKAIAENDDIITEIFADILHHQEKYEKALEAYKKLSLKYPEKSIYFAARIEEIQLKLKR